MLQQPAEFPQAVQVHLDGTEATGDGAAGFRGDSPFQVMQADFKGRFRREEQVLLESGVIFLPILELVLHVLHGPQQ